MEEVTFQFDDLSPQLENELEYAWGEDDSGNGDDIDNKAPPLKGCCRTGGMNWLWL